MIGDTHVRHHPAVGSPVILTVPHAGGVLHPDRPRITTTSERELRVMPLARGLAAGTGAAVVSTELHRAHMDANRGPDQEPYAPGFEAEYEAFHVAIDQAIGRTEGWPLLLDIHGFVAADTFTDYDVVLGSDEGRTAPGGADRLLAEGLGRRGYKVAHSPDPLLGLSSCFSGGWIVRRTAARFSRIDAVQIELNQTLRFSEARRAQLGADLLAALRGLASSRS